MQCVILAGGFGTRMLPLTSNLPKAMIKINDKPFIYYQLSWIIKHKIDKILICIGHFGDIIRSYVGNNFCGIPVDYVDEGENLLGTAGALALASQEKKLDDLFIVTYGDSFLPINYSDPFIYCIEREISALMTIYKNNGQFDNSNVMVIDDLILYDKKHITKPEEQFSYIDYGLSVLSKKIIDIHVPNNAKYDLSQLFHELSIKNELRGLEVYDRFYEVGSFAGLKDFTSWLELNGKFINNS